MPDLIPHEHICKLYTALCMIVFVFVYCMWLVTVLWLEFEPIKLIWFWFDLYQFCPLHDCYHLIRTGVFLDGIARKNYITLMALQKKKKGTKTCYIWAMSWENLFMPYANNKGADQPVHPRSQISACIVCCLDSIISLVSICKISSLYLASVVAHAGLGLPWSQTPKTGFLVTWLIMDLL